MVQAVDDYFVGSDKGNNASERSIANMKPFLERFERWLGAGKMIGDVTPDDAKRHLIDVLDGKLKGRNAPSPETVRNVGQLINTFMRHCNSRWDDSVIQKWSKMNCNGHYDEAVVNRLWLDQEQVDKLLRYLPKYWRDVAELQWSGGFRPEKLCNLQAENVELDDMRIRVKRFANGDGKTIWRRKTKNSTGDVPVLADCKATLARLVKAGTFLLFPFDPEASGADL